jgi:hypothetical protein
MSKINYYNDKKYENFKECFEDCVVSKIENLFEINLTYYINIGDMVRSLNMTVIKYGIDQYKLANICWQEENIECGYHDICQSNRGEFAIYDFAMNTFIKDIYLNDKYQDGSDGYLSDRLEYMFDEVADVLPELVDV